jgi:hypothetical protein
MQHRNDVHPNGDDLENCLLNRVSEQERQTIEEHLLICDPCRDALQDIHATLLARNQALEELEREQPVRSRKWVRFGFPTPAYAACGAAVIALMSWTYLARTGAPIPESQVTLAATRSGAASQSDYARAGSRVTLKLDTTSLPAAERYLVEVVDLSGTRIWSGEVPARTPALTVRLTKPVPAGRYWVRLNDTAGVPLREFDLPVR